MTKSRTRAAFPCLEVPGPDGAPVRHRIRGREASVGRDPSNEICIPHHLVSKFHAKLLVANQSVTVIDLESVNHTRVNGQIVTQSAVGYGDELQFARVKCRLLLLDSEVDVAAAKGVSA